MTTVVDISLRTIFWLTLMFIALTIYSLTFGQSSSYEFADWRVSRKFYDTIMPGLLIAILLTLTGTIKRTNNKSKNIGIISLTVLTSVVGLFIMTSMIFSVGFLTITNDMTLYRSKTNPAITITLQTIGQGALGADGHRTVQLEPFLKFWNKVTLVVTTTINKSDWTFANEKIDFRHDK